MTRSEHDANERLNRAAEALKEFERALGSTARPPARQKARIEPIPQDLPLTWKTAAVALAFTALCAWLSSFFPMGVL
jgi:ferric-dicitrate binding protein FerR (iron transport regulator)